MREIKFRVWDGEKMYYPNEENVYLKLIFFWHPNFCKYGLYDNRDDSLVTKSDRGMELMQYTGLKDKNGKEIYEGDVIAYITFEQGREDSTTLKTYGVVQYSSGTYELGRGDCYFTVYLHDINGAGEAHHVSPAHFATPAFYYTSKDFEVIGNIYENQELLKGDNK